LSQFFTWKEPEEILNLAQLIVYPRTLQNLSEIPDMLPRARVLKGALIEISSTELRLKVSHNESIRYFVPDSVARYVRTHIFTPALDPAHAGRVRLSLLMPCVTAGFPRAYYLEMCIAQSIRALIDQRIH